MDLKVLVLILALGNDSFAERENATIALLKLSRVENILPALLIGARHNDCEIRVRCKRLYIEACYRKVELYKKTNVNISTATIFYTHPTKGTLLQYKSRIHALAVGDIDAVMSGTIVYTKKSIEEYIKECTQYHPMTTIEICEHLDKLVGE